jgi:hypothetical protein
MTAESYAAAGGALLQRLYIEAFQVWVSASRSNTVNSWRWMLAKVDLSGVTFSSIKSTKEKPTSRT